MKFLFTLFLLVLYNCLSRTDAHGRLWEPAARSTAWRVDSSFPIYYNDQVNSTYKNKSQIGHKHF